MARRDALDLKIFSGVASQLENFGGEIFEDGGDVDGSYREYIGLGEVANGQRARGTRGNRGLVFKL